MPSKQLIFIVNGHNWLSFVIEETEGDSGESGGSNFCRVGVVISELSAIFGFAMCETRRDRLREKDSANGD